ncbi:insulinase family protein [Jiella endophytica]|uniref:Insulinase family protein n=1 Tax=Jiella endophytica TaxID=2558362 RepID=A0A4Y8RHI5_9HYPH|nr:pitrilysin family protein [Jiella endophytica]TFF22108.1 insulinase family protein [Jiella endophytica]
MTIASLSPRVRGLVAGLSFGLLAFSAAPAAAVDIQEVVSPGGIKALLVEDHSNPLIAVNFAFKGGGSTQDPEGKEGLANLLTGLLDEGAGDIKSADFQARLDDLGVSMSYDTSYDNFTGSFRTITDFEDQAFDLLHLALTEPRFDEEPVNRIRGQIVTGILANRNDPDEIASKAFRETVFAGHPYSRPTDGTPEALAKVTAADLESFRKKVFAKDDLVVGVVGDITPEDLKTRLDQVFGDLAARAELTKVPMAEPVLGKTVSVDLAVPQTNIRVAMPGVLRSDKDFFAAYLMNHVLGGGSFTSWLYEEIREKRGLAYGASSYLATYDHAGILGIATATRADAAPQTVDIIRKEIERMAKDGPTEQELEKAKAYVKGSYAVRNLDSSLAVAQTLVGIQLDDLGTDYIDKRQAIIDAVTLDDVKAAAKKLLDAKPTVVTVGSAGA